MTKGLININIIATNDIRGALFSKNNEPNLLKAASFIKMNTQLKQHSLLLDNGNALSGSLCMYYFSEQQHYLRNPLITIMNELQYDASGISPNDFKYGVKIFNDAQAMANFPFLSVNILHKRTKEPYFNTPYTIKHVGPMKVIIIGITPPSEMMNEKLTDVTHFEIENAVSAAKRWIRYLRDRHNPDYVIALYHGELNELSADVIEGIDLMITGEQSHLTYKGDTTMIEVPNNFKELKAIELIFKQRTNTFELVEYNEALVGLSTYNEDPHMAHLVHEERQSFNEWATTQVGYVEGVYNTQRFFSGNAYQSLLHDLLDDRITCCHLPHPLVTSLSGAVTNADVYYAYRSIDYPVKLLVRGSVLLKFVSKSHALLKDFKNGAGINPTTIPLWRGVENIKDDGMYNITTTDYIYHHFKDDFNTEPSKYSTTHMIHRLKKAVAEGI